jgi:hypothetical protein
MTSDNFCFYLQNRLIQTSQTGGQWYSDTSPFSILWLGVIALHNRGRFCIKLRQCKDRFNVNFSGKEAIKRDRTKNFDSGAHFLQITN